MKYEVKYSNNFQKSFKKLLKQDVELERDFKKVLDILIEGKKLPEKYRDHKLKGDLEGFYDFHLRHDLVVIRYYINIENKIIFHQIGTHSQVFG